jgi:hypothetical protein
VTLPFGREAKMEVMREAKARRKKEGMVDSEFS